MVLDPFLQDGQGNVSDDRDLFHVQSERQRGFKALRGNATDDIIQQV